ncbi:BREX-1 system adenine-specific DNA-methyltransferase PglX [uncultured Phascolarctobacterium sp.]|uniref:BREX-1 system adenine-specific DNA-methyltransferase PglX n=1 Tax=uncultured Phascolarctobacterium sp. TaxID=512296 RepID=UPI0025E78564|nr:BREX-1 system adenine-specific DNA-methyltransferase PglX [uncultured Phascolarctobacterium sp.]
MNKNAIKKFAVWARKELIERVSKKALAYGITEQEVYNPDADSVNGIVLTAAQKKERKALIEQIFAKGYKQVMEEIAYTWFNRFCALRFMEVNGFLPSLVRVFTNDKNEFRPQLLTEALDLDLPGLEKQKIYELKEANADEELYKYLLITQCNALNDELPRMFQRIEDYTELLFPDNLLREGSIIEQMIKLIPEADWQDAVQIIGWLYQYYNIEPKKEVFANLDKNIKIGKNDIPAATQLFTPDWIVRYMVENSLGRLVIGGQSSVTNGELDNTQLNANNNYPLENWKYYLPEAEQEPDVCKQLAELTTNSFSLTTTKCIDPCMGSGHILAYLFDVLMEVYRSEGYRDRDAVKNIINNNLYGLDIDERAAQLAYFAVMMQGRKYDNRFLTRHYQPHIYAITESNGIDRELLAYFGVELDALNRENALNQLNGMLDEMEDACEYGSLITVSEYDFALLKHFVAAYDAEQDLLASASLASLQKRLQQLIAVAETLAQKYEVVVTNPPYMGAGNMNPKLSGYVKKHYPDSKSDMSTVMMERTLAMCNENGFMSMINIPVWMFLSSYEKLRNKILKKNTYVNMLHFGRGVFGSDFGSTAFVISKKRIENYRASYRRLFEKQGAVDSVEVKEQWFFEGKGKYVAQQENFAKIPGAPVAYWASKQLINDFDNGNLLSMFGKPSQGMSTCDVNRFTRLWFEPSICDTNIELKNNILKWVKYNKGGSYRKWYGNREYLVFWNKNGCVMQENGALLRNKTYYFKPFVAWTKVSSANTGFRYFEDYFLFDGAGGTLFLKDESNIQLFLGLLNSNVIAKILNLISPTLNFNENHIGSIPIIGISDEEEGMISGIVKKNISLSKSDWDSFETSWDFAIHPLLSTKHELLADAYASYKQIANSRFAQLKANEEELNRIFIDIYGLQDELTPGVEDKDVTVHRIFDSKDDVPEAMKGSNYILTQQQVVKSLISYAVGCMFGRYSLDKPGLVYAGGEWDAGNYQTFAADKDAIIPISDNEYFNDDIVARFVEFIRTAFGAEEGMLEANLSFIASSLGGSGSARDVIRAYFNNGFYADHCKTYQKRPIYWLFDSGKKNGFKCLIYMHRYQKDTIARIRTDYLHEQQSRYRTAIGDLQNRIDNAVSTGVRVKLQKQLAIVQAQVEETRLYEEKIHHLADQMLEIDLDDGVKHNYDIFKDVLAKMK